uniref:Uncharacterized protein n=1 Tax=Arundo donax TaxID=35708 RepID=A0A0A8XYQ3_ARUDO
MAFHEKTNYKMVNDLIMVAYSSYSILACLLLI